MINTYELKKLNLNHFNQIILDNYITFLKYNFNIDNNELLIIVYLTTQNKYNKVLYNKTNKDYTNSFIKMFMFNYYNNIKYLKKIIKINKRSFKDLTTFLSNKKRIYSYFENINNTNISFYLPIIINFEYPNS